VLYHELVFLARRAAQMTMMVMRSCLEAICATSTFIDDIDAKEKGKRELIKVCASADRVMRRMCVVFLISLRVFDCFPLFLFLVGA
jgi:hypothetical protein